MDGEPDGASKVGMDLTGQLEDLRAPQVRTEPVPHREQTRRERRRMVAETVRRPGDRASGPPY